MSNVLEAEWAQAKTFWPVVNIYQEGGDMSDSRIMTQIERVVVVMIENRSLDNLLGWLYTDDCDDAATTPSFDGVKEGMHNTYKGAILPVHRNLRDAVQPFRVPRLDPHEDFPHVTKQLFANGGGEMPCRIEPGVIPKMQGFAWDFDAFYESSDMLSEVMGAYDNSLLPIINGLARHYAVSDAWYSSVPSQTNPNRAFSICGTSLGRTSNLHEDAIETFKTKTIWNALPADVSWGLYYQDIWEDKKCYTQYTFPQIDEAPGSGEIADINIFYAKAKSGQLPQFTYLEPAWGYGLGNESSFNGKQGNDYHPPTWVGPGEVFLNSVYEALIANKDAWKNTLLVITCDEHGGTYDHVPPPWGAISPDNCRNSTGFGFDRFGVRVPTLLVSPFVTAGTVFRAHESESHIPFDHTSLIATILRWQGVDPASAGLGARVAQAPLFDAALSAVARDDTPRFEVPPGYAEQGGGIENIAEAEGLSLARTKVLIDRGGTTEEILNRLREYSRPAHSSGY